MTLKIEIEPETETRLEAEAQRNGVSKNDMAKTVIEQRFGSVENGRRDDDLPRRSRYIGPAEMRDFSGDRQWVRENSERFQGQFVALYGNRLIANGAKLKEVAGKAKSGGISRCTFEIYRAA